MTAMREDLRAALDRAGDVEERAARAEMELARRPNIHDYEALLEEVDRLKALMASLEGQPIHSILRIYPNAEDLMKTALEVRDACRAKERSLAVLLRSFRKTFEKTDGFDPRHCQPTVEKDNFLHAIYSVSHK